MSQNFRSSRLRGNPLALAAFSLAAITVAAVPALHAQEVSGAISGTISDPSGALIPGATIVLTNTDRNQEVRTLTTDGKGYFTATSLPLGTYSVMITDQGFRTVTITGLVLHVDDKLTVNQKLAIGSEAAITVSADQLRVNLEDSAFAGLINGTQVRELVLSTRNYEQLLSLQPGVAYAGTTDQIYMGPTNPLGGANTVAFSVNGQRTAANNWTIDGADNVDRGSNLTLLAFPSVDAIGEFKTLRGTYSAEFGRSAAGQVNVVTRSGTSHLHGTAYEFFRNDYLNANSYANKQLAVIPKRAPLRYNDFGYTLGGPVVIPKVYDGRDKTFFFFSQELRRVITYTPLTVNVPTLNERKGLFPVAICTNFVGAGQSCADAGTTQITNFSPTALSYLKDVFSTDGSKVPLPNANSVQDEHAYTFNARNVFNDTQEILRVDHAIGEKLQLFYRFVHDSIPTIEPSGYASGGSGLPGVGTTQSRSPATQHLAHATYIFTPKTLLEGGYAYSSGAIISRPIGAAAVGNSPDIKVNVPFVNQLGVIPGIGFSGYTGVTNAGNYDDYNRNHNVFGNLTHTLGRHTLIVGATFDHYQKTENALGGNNGTFNFGSNVNQLPAATKTNTGSTTTTVGTLATEASGYYQSFANFLSGTATGGFIQQPTIRIPDLRANTYEGFVQDNWKVNPRLTLNLGVRYTYFEQPTDRNNTLSNFNPSTYSAAKAPTVNASGTLCTSTATCTGGNQPNPNYDPLNGLTFSGGPNAATHPSPYGSRVGKPDNKNFAPRAGLAFDVFGNGRTAFRMGYGIGFDASLFGDYEQNAFNNPPFPSASQFTFTSFDNPAAGTAASAAVPAATVIYSTAPAFHTPYSQQYSVDVQQEITSSFTLDLGYYGSHDTHLIGYVDINQLAPGQARAAGIVGPAGFVSTGATPAANALRPYRGYSYMYSIQPIFSSNYNSLQVAVKKRFKGKSLIDGNFTWQKYLTNSPADRSGAPQDKNNIAAEYGRSILDRKTYATIDFIYEIPFFKDQRGLVGHLLGGFEVSGIVALNSGLPATVTASAGSALFGTTTAFSDVAGLAISGNSPAGFRPDQISDPNSGTGLHTKTRWFNQQAFALPNAAAGLPGNARRGNVVLPGFNREDLGIFRNFRIFGESELQLRGEAFNVLNHTNFNGVQTNATTSTFGMVTGARETRILQIGAKLNF